MAHEPVAEEVLYFRVLLSGSSADMDRARRFALENVSKSLDRLPVQAQITAYTEEGKFVRSTQTGPLDPPPDELAVTELDT